MSEVQDFVLKVGVPTVHATLGHVHATGLSAALENDVRGYAHSAVVSLVDLLSGIGLGFRSWPIVKSYYSLFYAVRALCGANGYCIFYDGTKARRVRARPGEVVERVIARNSHKAIFEMAAKTHGTHVLLSQKIALDDPFGWMATLREAANYKVSSFVEPDTPDCLRWICGRGVRAGVSAYLKALSENDHLYTFDPDHAIVAYPLAWIAELSSRVSGLGAERLSFTSRAAKDRDGPFSSLIELLKPMC